MGAENICFGRFIWNRDREKSNIAKHGVGFIEASKVFCDEFRIIAKDERHCDMEDRIFCIGVVGERVITVRFVYRNGKIRIFGAGAWRKGRELYYEKKR